MSDFRRKLMMYKKSESELPSEYQKVDYIENPLGAYIDLDIKATCNTNAFYKYKPLALEIYACFLGAESGFLFPSFRPNINPICSYCGNSIVLSPKPNPDAQGFYQVEAFWNNEIKINDETYLVSKGDKTESLYNMRLFEWTSDFKHKTSAQTCFVKIYEEDKLIRDLIPCYRKSDGEVGLFDSITRAFFTNNGTGSLTYGYL